MEAPRITIYARVLDNKDESVLRGYEDVYKNNVWFFGKMNGVNSNESPFVMEFDIWNNEPALNAFQNNTEVLEAKNCRIEAWDTSDLTTTSQISYNNNLFVHTRCVTHDFNQPFKPIAGTWKVCDEIYGNVSYNEKGVLKGQLGGDRAKIQTKIILPAERIEPGERKFVLAFYYDFE